MGAYIDSMVTDAELRSDIRELIPDAGLRRRMSRVVKSGVATAMECLRGVGEGVALDAIVTATGYGCLADSEKFLRNVINDHEELLNPTPFIQSTFNTVGGHIALMRHDHCYNMTYANGAHSFEDALLDAMMQLSDGEAGSVLLGAFDEKTESQERIMSRMGAFRNTPCGEGCVFMHITASPVPNSRAEIVKVDFPTRTMSRDECLERYAGRPDAVVLYNEYRESGIYPTVAAGCLARAVAAIGEGCGEAIVYNEYWGNTPTVIVVRCIG